MKIVKKKLNPIASMSKITLFSRRVLFLAPNGTRLKNKGAGGGTQKKVYGFTLFFVCNYKLSHV